MVNERYLYTGDYSSYNQAGEIIKRQKTECEYTLLSEAVMKGVLSKLIFKIDHFSYREDVKEKTDWKFAKGLEFPYYSYSFRKEEDMFRVSDKSIYMQIFKHFDRINTLQKSLPKLPSTFLVYMTYFDLIAFEEYTSKIVSCKDIIHGKYVQLKDLSSMNTNMLGLLGGCSAFQNGDFYVQGMGNYSEDRKKISSYDYYCLNSSVEVNNNFGSRKGISNYYGSVMIHEPKRKLCGGIMMENYLPIDNTKYNYILRSIKVERIYE